MSEIRLKSIKNIRDFEGIVTADGKNLKRGHFIRSSALYDLSRDDRRILFDEFRVRTVIDLRTEAEVEQKPDSYPKGVTYINLPLIDEATAGITHEQRQKRDLSAVPDMRDLYRLVVTNEKTIANFREIFRLILSSYEKGAVLWHCTEGKDRCGLVSALFLSLLGVERDEVTANYLLTNLYNKWKARKYYCLILLYKWNRQLAKKVRGMFIADESYLDAALDAIDEQFGGIESYLKNQLGITDEQRKRLREFYLTD
ncbi:MAG: tyrosine-protein phosphatase [Ruminococcus sp.]|nr:tyrosine-protein phosphatase [Ruminococcus sp.]